MQNTFFLLLSCRRPSLYHSRFIFGYDYCVIINNVAYNIKTLSPIVETMVLGWVNRCMVLSTRVQGYKGPRAQGYKGTKVQRYKGPLPSKGQGSPILILPLTMGPYEIIQVEGVKLAYSIKCFKNPFYKSGLNPTIIG